MSGEMKAKLSKATDAAKHQSWKWLGAMFMEEKGNGKGETHLATSLTRVLTLGMFISVTVYWWVMPETVPATMVQTLWGLLGLKGATKVAEAVRK